MKRMQSAHSETNMIVILDDFLERGLGDRKALCPPHFWAQACSERETSPRFALGPPLPLILYPPKKKPCRLLNKIS